MPTRCEAFQQGLTISRPKLAVPMSQHKQGRPQRKGPEVGEAACRRLGLMFARAFVVSTLHTVTGRDLRGVRPAGEAWEDCS